MGRLSWPAPRAFDEPLEQRRGGAAVDGLFGEARAVAQTAASGGVQRAGGAHDDCAASGAARAAEDRARRRRVRCGVSAGETARILVGEPEVARLELVA